VELVTANVVVVANQFNPSIVTQLWLVENELVSRDDFLHGGFFTEVVANVPTRQFGLFVTPPQLQFAPAPDSEDQQRIITDKLGRFLQLLPHTPYSAIGLNFVWHLKPEDGDTARVTRELFFREGFPLFRAFDSPDARYGGYLSKDALGCRLKLDVKPIAITSPEGVDNRVQFSFNFHYGIIHNAESPVSQIQRVLDQWNQARQITFDIVEELANATTAH
jgi:hypothetical protein